MRRLLKSLLIGLLSTVVIAASAQGQSKVEYEFVPTMLRSEYLRMPTSELSPMLDWLERIELKALGIQGVTDPVSPTRVSPLLIHTMLLHGQDAQALSMIQAARLATDKPLQRNMLFLTEGLLAQANVERWNDTQFATAAAQRVAALPWPAARSRLKNLLHSLDITPFDKTLALAAATDEAYRTAPLNLPNVFASDIVEARFSGEIVGPHASNLRAIIKERLDREASGPDYWQQRAYPQLPAQGQFVRVAVWEPDGVDIGLFRHPATACLIVGPGADCLVDPHIDGMDRSRAWAFVKGYHDFFSDDTTPQAQAWRDWQGQRVKEIGQLTIDPRRHEQLIQAMQHLGQATNEVAEAQTRQHGTHVAGIVVQNNPFVELVAIRNKLPLTDDPAAFHRISDFLRANKVRVVNMSWGFAANRYPPADVAAFEKQMMDLLSVFPDILFVAASGNDDDAIDKHRFLPASLVAPNLLTIGAVDQDGQVTFFTNVGSHVALYANGDAVRSVGPTGYSLEMSGTSMAAPQVCNVAAKLLSQHPGLSVAELKRLLIDGADELPAGDQLPIAIKVLNPAHSAVLSGR